MSLSYDTIPIHQVPQSTLYLGWDAATGTYPNFPSLSRWFPIRPQEPRSVTIRVVIGHRFPQTHTVGSLSNDLTLYLASRPGIRRVEIIIDLTNPLRQQLAIVLANFPPTLTSVGIRVVSLTFDRPEIDYVQELSNRNIIGETANFVYPADWIGDGLDPLYGNAHKLRILPPLQPTLFKQSYNVFSEALLNILNGSNSLNSFILALDFKTSLAGVLTACRHHPNLSYLELELSASMEAIDVYGFNNTDDLLPSVLAIEITHFLSLRTLVIPSALISSKSLMGIYSLAQLEHLVVLPTPNVLTTARFLQAANEAKSAFRSLMFLQLGINNKNELNDCNRACLALLFPNTKWEIPFVEQ